MIGRDPAEAQSVADAYGVAIGDPADPLLDAFRQTLLDPQFPGGIFGATRPGQPPVFYAAAQSQGQWRRLRPLLLAFAGPTLTDFAGAPSTLDRSNPAERVLSDAGFAAVARLSPNRDTSQSTDRALRRLVAAVARTPAEAEPPPETTGTILARIRDHLNGLAIEPALTLLEQCRGEHRLDALNLKFLEVEIRAAARDWQAIVSMGGFDDLLQTRRPPAVTAALLEALYGVTYGAEAVDPGQYTGLLRARARALVRLPPVAGLQAGGWRLYGLEALASEPPDAAIAQAALSSGADLGGLEPALRGILAPRPEVAEETPLAKAAGALVDADLNGGLSALERARALFDSLSREERELLLRDHEPRRAVAALDETYGSGSIPLDWSAWLDAIAHAGFTTAAAVARQGAREWAADLGDPAEIAILAEQLVSARDEPPTSDRLLEGLPHLVAWLQRDAAFPRAAAYPVYEAALDRLMLSGRTAAPMLDSANVLARAMLSIGPSRAAYDRLLTDLLEFSGESAGQRSAYWLIELLEETVAAPTPDQAARERFWSAVVARLSPIATQLSTLQRQSLVRLAAALGWASALPDSFGNEVDTEADATLAGRLAGKLVAIYTLTESAGTQASDILRGLAPDLDVRVNSDHAGTRPLRALAENADLFVVVAASATHAATDVIRSRRGAKPLVYAAGRGAVSILRAVEDWASRVEET